MKQKTLPDSRRFFWWTKSTDINLDESRKDIILQVINYGGWRHWQWLVGRYGREKLKGAILEIPESAFFPRGLKLIKLLLGIKSFKYASRSDYIRAKKNFREA